ncbi:MAG: LysR family transcriptional regulator [Rubrivivax sp.]|nr:LysR family transcriptional regulator [Rubrivivax sp.]
MNALVQHSLGAAELGVLLALVRAGTLAGAGQLLGVDGSTVFRGVQRTEKALGQRLFERSRAGYRATEIGLLLAQHAERVESELEAARAAALGDAGAVVGTVRISTTDSILNSLLLPVLPALMAQHPQLQIEVSASNEFANLTQREADIAIRATGRPPPHLVGRQLGPSKVAVFAASRGAGNKNRKIDLSTAPWIAMDDALPAHPWVRWRRKHYPKAVPRVLVNSVQSVFEGIVAGVGVGILPLFLARRCPDLVAVSDALDECEAQLWLLTHPESRHLRRISTVAAHLANTIAPR